MNFRELQAASARVRELHAATRHDVTEDSHDEWEAEENVRVNTWAGDQGSVIRSLT